MQKIIFEDTEVTKQPYVEINNVEYEVQDGTYIGGTDLNADTFNTMQDNIENAIEEVQNVELIAISDVEPSECTTGDKYYNTEDNLIYTAIATDTWSEDGEEPTSGIFYILFSEQSSYSYDGTTLVSVGGGTEDIIISEDEPTTDDWKLWIDTGEIGSASSEVVDTLSGNETNKAPSVRAVNTMLKGTILYNNSSGNNGTITLSDSVANYEYLEIYFSNSNGTNQRMSSQKFDLSFGNKCSLFTINSDTGNNMYFSSREINISGNTLSTLDSTRHSSANINLTTSQITITNTNSIYINKVIGYKEV